MPTIFTQPPDDILQGFRRALRRSRIRAEILLVLLEHGRLSLADLARMVEANSSNVYWAIWGDNEPDPKRKRYKIAESLVVLGLVDLVEVDDTKLYELSLLGQAVARRLRAELDKRRGPMPRVKT